MPRFKGDYAHFRFNKCPIYTYDGANAKCNTNSHETDYSVYKYEVRGSFGNLKLAQSSPHLG
jgi:hypothetical protein